jgi:iron(III) transport system substrate-binding protein
LRTILINGISMRALSAIVLTMLAMCGNLASAETLVVYTARNEQLIKPVFDRFTSETGIEVKFLTDKEAPLLARLKAEGARTPADILMTVDAGNLWQAPRKACCTAGLGIVADQYPGASARPRGPLVRIFAARPYADLQHRHDIAAETLHLRRTRRPRMERKLCLRTSKKVYNQSLIADEHRERHGEEATEAMVRGWVAQPRRGAFCQRRRSHTRRRAADVAPSASSTPTTSAAWRAVARNCRWHCSGPTRARVKRGVHVNVSGAGMLRHAKNPAAAKRFLEWLSQGEAQAIFASGEPGIPGQPGRAGG